MKWLLHHLMEASAARTPEKTAVVWKGDSFTYEELERKSTRLANVLREESVQPGDRVGIYLTKSLWPILSIHAVLKTGAAYVPVDPNSPTERVNGIIRAAGMRCLITDASRLNRIATVDGLQTILHIDDLQAPVRNAARVLDAREAIDAASDRPKGSPRVWTELAYILFTSGSTGVPKGVMISHLNALNFVNWACDAFDVSHEDVLSNHAPYHFDLSILDVFAAMKCGATVAVVPSELSTFPYRLSEWIHGEGITVWYSVPSILAQLAVQGGMERFSFEHLRTVLFAGEVFPIKYLHQLSDALPNTKLYNLYGPTETNVITYYEVTKRDRARSEPLPIGQVCDSMDVFLVDEGGNVVTEPHVEGEIWACGPNVAHGYWADASGTERGFVNDFRQLHFRERAYRTGDIAKLDETGNLILLGRGDDMIKSRGYRIELGEIESVLYRHPMVEEAAVVGVPDIDLGHRIRAFVVIRNGAELTEEQIRVYSAKFLPKYMLPEIVTFQASLPKTSTGKVDKTALKADASVRARP